jgi:Tol biopolymer transport system component
MVCTNSRPESADLTVAPFDRSTPSLGASSVLVKDRLVASPSFSPDGKTVAYSPDTSGGPFQLSTIPAAMSTAPTPMEISSTLDLDATSAPVWVS